MSTNGKGSKRRPETQPGTFVKNWDEIDWSKKETLQSISNTKKTTIKILKNLR